MDISGVQTVRDLSGALRALRRRHARVHGTAELTYRELATRTGWSTAAVAEYLTGKTLPPTDRFDVLIGLFGATPAEQGLLATARDRVAEQQRQARPQPSRPAPRQLPADVFSFTGRGDELARLDAMLEDPPTAMVISAVAGTAGVGKTALAVHWAHRVAGRFPDGQLYVNLRGYDPEQPMATGDALARLLAALGVPGDDIPLDIEDRAARYRTELADRRMLVVLDNAATEGQVRPLLPGSPSCTVIVTSRDSLSGLVARDGARRVDLDLLPLPDAAALLRQLIGARADAEPEAVAELARLCARLPLALRVAAERAVSHPSLTLAELTAQLADHRQRLALMDARVAVTEVFSWSVQHLPPAAAHTFRLLGLHPGPDLDRGAAAALAGTDAPAHLDVLARAHLVHPTAPGRYGMHDLLRAYANQLSKVDDGALERLLEFYLSTARAAMGVLHADTSGEPTFDPESARAWLDTERANLVAVAAHAIPAGRPEYAIELAAVLARYFDGGHYIDGLAVHTHAYRAARLTGDAGRQGRALVDLGCTHMRLSQYEPAAGSLREALALLQRAGDHAGQAHALTSLGKLERRRGRQGPAARYLRRALTLARQAADRTGQARTLLDLGTVEVQRGRYPAALAHLQQALVLVTEVGSRLGQAGVLANLGQVEQRLGRHEAAAEHLHRSLAMFRELGHRQAEADVLEGLGSAQLRLGRPGQASGHFTGALGITREIGDRHGESMALNGLGDAARAAGRPAESVAHHAEALTIADAIGARDSQARAHAGLGQAHSALGDLAAACRHFEHALAGYTELQSAAEAHTVRAQLDALRRKPS